jgi:hypothetical protein
MTDLSFMDHAERTWLDAKRASAERLASVYGDGMKAKLRHIREDAGSLQRYTQLLANTLPLEVGSCDEAFEEAESALVEALFAVRIARGQHDRRPKLVAAE